jgi:hypothetical protein
MASDILDGMRLEREALVSRYGFSFAFWFRQTVPWTAPTSLYSTYTLVSDQVILKDIDSQFYILNLEDEEFNVTSRGL